MRITIRSLGDAPLTLTTNKRPRTLDAARSLIRQYQEQYKAQHKSISEDTTALAAFIATVRESNNNNT